MDRPWLCHGRSFVSPRHVGEPASAPLRGARGWSCGPPAADPRSPRFARFDSRRLHGPPVASVTGGPSFHRATLANPRPRRCAAHAGGAVVRLRRILAHLASLGSIPAGSSGNHSGSWSRLLRWWAWRCRAGRAASAQRPTRRSLRTAATRVATHSVPNSPTHESASDFSVSAGIVLELAVDCFGATATACGAASSTLEVVHATGSTGSDGHDLAARRSCTDGYATAPHCYLRCRDVARDSDRSVMGRWTSVVVHARRRFGRGVAGTREVRKRETITCPSAG
jgi:hypothetical protein